jgi:hypothetical protein
MGAFILMIIHIMSLCRLYIGGDTENKISLNCPFKAKMHLLNLKYSMDENVSVFAKFLHFLHFSFNCLFGLRAYIVSLFTCFFHPAANRDKLKEKSHEMDIF